MLNYSHFSCSFHSNGQWSFLEKKKWCMTDKSVACFAQAVDEKLITSWVFPNLKLIKRIFLGDKWPLESTAMNNAAFLYYFRRMVIKFCVEFYYCFVGCENCSYWNLHNSHCSKIHAFIIKIFICRISLKLRIEDNFQKQIGYLSNEFLRNNC